MCNMDHDYVSIGFIVVIFLPCLLLTYLFIMPFLFIGFLITVLLGEQRRNRERYKGDK